MSARLEKLKRRAARVEAGLSAAAIDEQREFDAEVSRLRYRLAGEADGEIRSLAPRRRALALAWAALVLFTLAVSFCVAAALGARYP